MSHGKGLHLDHHMGEVAAGVAAELVKQGGYLSGQAGNTAYRALTGTHMSHTGAQAVQSLASYAPGGGARCGYGGPAAGDCSGCRLRRLQAG